MTVAEVIEEKESSNIQLGTPEPFSGQCLEVEQGLRSVYSELFDEKSVFYLFIEETLFFDGNKKHYSSGACANPRTCRNGRGIDKNIAFINQHHHY